MFEDLELLNNSFQSKATKESIKKFSKEMMDFKINSNKRCKSFEEERKVILACMLYKKVQNKIDSGEEIKTSLDIYLDTYMNICIDNLIRLSNTSPNDERLMIELIKSRYYQLGTFFKLQDNEINEILNIQKLSSKIGDVLNDEVYSIRLFNNDDNVIINQNKLNNLKKLYNTILYPIIIYYKQKLSITNNILIVSKGLSNENNLQQKGMAVLFYLVGIESSTIFEDLENDVIEVNFGTLKMKNNNEIFISLPYSIDDGKIIEKQIEKGVEI